MPENVEFKKEKKLILVNSFGEVCIEEWNESLNTVMKISAIEKCRNILVDVRQQLSSPDTFDIHSFGANLPRGFKFAVVMSTEGSKNHVYLERVSSDSAKHLKVFNSYDEALKWLN